MSYVNRKNCKNIIDKSNKKKCYQRKKDGRQRCWKTCKKMCGKGLEILGLTLPELLQSAK